MSDRPLLSERAAAREFGISRDALRQARQEGTLPAYRPTERTIRYFRADIERWIRSRVIQPVAPRDPSLTEEFVGRRLEKEKASSEPLPPPPPTPGSGRKS